MKRSLCAVAIFSTCAVAATAHDTVAPEIIRTVVPAIQKCWSPPPQAAGDQPHVSLKVRFNADGTLNGDPEIVTKAEGDSGEAFTASTIRAIQKCQPYDALQKFPHDRWHEIIINFDL